MTASMPGIGPGQHFSGVNYAATFSGLSAFAGRVTFGCPGGTVFTFGFETGRTQVDPQLDLWQVSYDYSWFDQAAEEAAIASALSGICAILGQLLSLPSSDVEQSVTVQRVWTFALDIQGSAAAQQIGNGSCTITEVMPYPPQVAGADTASAAEAGQALVQ